MELADRRTVQRLLKQYGITPRKHWGQHFLVSRSMVRRIIDAAALQPDETVLEIGAGLGALTVELARRAGRVIAVERDLRLCAALKHLLAPYPNTELVCTDARALPDDKRPARAYALVANLPYGTGTVILRTILEHPNPPHTATVMLQREVAERIAAQPPHASLLSVTIQHLAEPTVLFRVPHDAVWPPPEVDSTVLQLKTRMPRPSKKAHDALVAAAKRGFAHPRKFVLRNIAADRSLRERIARSCGIAETARPQELTLNQWACVAQQNAASPPQ